MAKKKSEANTGAGAEKAEAKKDAPAKKPAAKGGAKKGAAKKPAGAQAAGGSSMIDTDLATQNAARMLVGRAKLKGATGNDPTPTGGDSASFKQMKENLSNPTSQSSLGLNKALGPQKTHLPVKEYNQIFHNQTQGGVARINVPRRTGG